MKIVDDVFDYRDPSYGRDSSCRLRVYEMNKVDMFEYNVVIATEISRNPGPSVTNTAEAWAAEVCTEYELDPKRTYFVEHYDHRTNVDRDQETYDFIEFTWRGDRAESPKWRPGTKTEIEKLVGEAI